MGIFFYRSRGPTFSHGAGAPPPAQRLKAVARTRSAARLRRASLRQATPTRLPRWGPRQATPTRLPRWGPRQATPTRLPRWGPRRLALAAGAVMLTGPLYSNPFVLG